MAAMDEGKMDVVVPVKREQGKKDDPLKMHTVLPASMIFQQLLERIVPDIVFKIFRGLAPSYLSFLITSKPVSKYNLKFN